MVTRLLARFKLEAPVRQLIARLVQLFVLCLFVIMAMQNLGVEPAMAQCGPLQFISRGRRLGLFSVGLRQPGRPTSPSCPGRLAQWKSAPGACPPMAWPRGCRRCEVLSHE